MKQRHTLGDYLRALFRALQMTLRGETIKPPAPRYPDLQAWIDRGVTLTQAAFAAAEAHGLDESARKLFRMNLESRDISMQTILGAVQHNLTREYPLLIKSNVAHHLTALYAFNLDDRYRVMKLAEGLDTYPPVQNAVKRLSEHLNAIPSSPKP